MGPCKPGMGHTKLVHCLLSSNISSEMLQHLIVRLQNDSPISEGGGEDFTPFTSSLPGLRHWEDPVKNWSLSDKTNPLKAYISQDFILPSCGIVVWFIICDLRRWTLISIHICECSCTAGLSPQIICRHNVTLLLLILWCILKQCSKLSLTLCYIQKI